MTDPVWTADISPRAATHLNRVADSLAAAADRTRALAKSCDGTIAGIDSVPHDLWDIVKRLGFALHVLQHVDAMADEASYIDHVHGLLEVEPTPADKAHEDALADALHGTPGCNPDVSWPADFDPIIDRLRADLEWLVVHKFDTSDYLNTYVTLIKFRRLVRLIEAVTGPLVADNRSRLLPALALVQERLLNRKSTEEGTS